MPVSARDSDDKTKNVGLTGRGEVSSILHVMSERSIVALACGLLPLSAFFRTVSRALAGESWLSLREWRCIAYHSCTCDKMLIILHHVW